MSIRSRPRRSRLLAALALVFAVGGGCAVSAQTAAPIDRCAPAGANQQERIACLEAGIVGLVSAPIEQCRKTVGDRERVRCLKAFEAALAEIIAAQTTGQPKSPRGKPLAATPAETNRERVIASLSSAKAEEFGSEQVKQRTKSNDARDDEGSDEKEELQVNIAKFELTPFGTYMFHLDNGQVWRQKNSDVARLRLSSRKTYTAVLTRGVPSGYRLKLSGYRGNLLVERIE